MSFGMACATKKYNKKMAKGGFVAEEEASGMEPLPMEAEEDQGGDLEDDADMIARIMHKRKEYSRGGMVANDVGVAEADKLPAEFDDLVLDDHLEDDSGAGNEHGDADQEDRDADVISKIMASRKKKDRMPRPA